MRMIHLNYGLYWIFSAVIKKRFVTQIFFYVFFFHAKKKELHKRPSFTPHYRKIRGLPYFASSRFIFRAKRVYVWPFHVAT